jgi:hypothetical protein
METGLLLPRRPERWADAVLGLLDDPSGQTGSPAVPSSVQARLGQEARWRRYALYREAYERAR